MRTKHAERLQARKLRREGRSIKEIAALTRIAQSSASIWVRDIELTERQRQVLVARARDLRTRSRSRHFRERRSAFQAEGAELASRRDAGHIAGCMLYWAEGSKSRNMVQFVNSDPAVVRFFVEFLRRYYDVSDEAFRIDCNLFADHVERQREIERFWLETSPCRTRACGSRP